MLAGVAPCTDHGVFPAIWVDVRSSKTEIPMVSMSIDANIGCAVGYGQRVDGLHQNPRSEQEISGLTSPASTIGITRVGPG
jgi:hypothetical protein